LYAADRLVRVAGGGRGCARRGWRRV